MPLAASMADPPPTATSAMPRVPGLSRATASAPAARSAVTGLGLTPVKTTAVIPDPASAFSTLATTGVAASAASVTTTAASLPVPPTIGPSLLMAPAPKCAVGVGVMTISAATDSMITPAVGGGGVRCR